MPSSNTYPGYVKLPGKDIYHAEIRLDFNAQIVSNPEDTRIKSFNLRLFTLPTSKEMGKGLHPELSVSLTSEQWLDLTEAMRAEIDRSDDTRKQLEDLDNPE